ncbi:MAG: hypothetical protein CALGDGBN_00171 [Pseudomonadales bacterium]|nr:hypothetical protein [Pseudomonadales bacterium]
MDTIANRLAAVRAAMHAQQLAALLVPRADEYLGEYLPERNERLRWLSGFGGSAGLAIVLPDKAAIFVDGRYTVQVRQQTPATLFEYHHLIEEPHAAWLADRLPAGARVGHDPRLHTAAWHKTTAATLARRGVQLVALDDNLVDSCWHDRPPAPVEPALLLDSELTGRSSADKRREIATQLGSQAADAALIFAPDSVAWLLNLRGHDVPHLPLVLAHALLHADGRLEVFTDPRKLPAGFAVHAGEGVGVLSADALDTALARLAGKRVLLDPETTNAWCRLRLEAHGAEVVEAPDPVLLPKACKNAAEIAGMRAAHRRDAIAMVRFLAWLDAEVDAGRLHDEAVLAERLHALRAGGERFHDLSFDTISAAGANAALCHYRHSDSTPGRLTMDSVYLVDSGAQYLDGTTDITRTVAIGDPGAEVRRLATLVMKGHIALARARFPEGTTGSQLDVLARQFLWRQGFDYDHGTGHGVGCFLSVHEGPQRIGKAGNAVALRPGMVLSDEPGYYREGAFGIRHENLVLVTAAATPAGGERPMFGFEALTLVPFDRRLLDAALLTESETAWLDEYHRLVRETIGPLLEGTDRHWLERATRALR